MKKYPLPKGVHIDSIKGKRVFKGIRYNIYQWRQKLFNGKTATYETVARTPSVVVLPVEGDSVYILKERQPHWNETYAGFIAGGVEDKETLEGAARRELLEEAGIVCKKLHLVHIEQYVSGIEWFGYTFIATGLSHTGTTAFDGGEDIKIEKVSVNRLIEMTRKREFKFKPRFIEHWLVTEKEAELKKFLKKPRTLFK